MTRRLAIALLFCIAACQGGGDTPRGIAERFLDEHYVRMNLPGAREYTTGLAASKVLEMEHLIDGQEIDAGTRKPHVSYTLKETKDETDDSVSLLYEGVIRVEDADTFTRHWLITMRKQEDGAWRVSNFQEFE